MRDIGKFCLCNAHNRLKRSVLIPLILPTLTLRVPPLARAFGLLGELSILVILEMPLARLLDLTPLEVLAQLAFGVIEEVAHLVRQAVFFPAISIGCLLQMPRGTVLVSGRTIPAVLRLEQSVCLAPMVLAFSAYLSRLMCLAIYEPADVVIGKTLRDTAWEHTLKFKAQTVVPVLRNKMILSLPCCALKLSSSPNSLRS